MVVGTGASLAASGTGTITATAVGTLASLTVNGAANINASNDAATNIGTGTTTSTVAVGGGANQFAINTVNWDVSSAGVFSGLTGLTVAGVTNLNASADFATNIGTGTTNAAVTIGNTANTVTVAGGTNTVTGITNVNTTGSAATNIGTSATAGLVSLGGGSNQFAINTVNWDITNLGVASGLTGLTVAGVTNVNTSGTAATTIGNGTTATVAINGVTSINATNNAATNIGTGTTNAAVNIGGTANAVVLGATKGITIQANGHVNAVSSAPPTISACGGAGVAIQTGSTDVAGHVTAGTTAITACVLNFGTTFATAPYCTVTITNATVAIRGTTSTTQLTITYASAASRQITWICLGL
jgi:hypothetical protein